MTNYGKPKGIFNSLLEVTDLLKDIQRENSDIVGPLF